MRYHWPPEAGTPQTRDGGADPRWPRHRPWDSDYLLLTLAALVEKLGVPVLAAGDLNESRLDDPEGGTWAEEYFAHAEQRGLAAWLHQRWGSERPTRRGLQLDHVLVGGGAERLLTVEPPPYVDPAWAEHGAEGRSSDHAAVWFALTSP